MKITFIFIFSTLIFSYACCQSLHDVPVTDGALNDTTITTAVISDNSSFPSLTVKISDYMSNTLPPHNTTNSQLLEELTQNNGNNNSSSIGDYEQSKFDIDLEALKSVRINGTRVNLLRSTKQVLEQQEFAIDTQMCFQVENVLLNSNNNSSSNNSTDISFYKYGTELTKMLVECHSGWSNFSYFALENCVISIGQEGMETEDLSICFDQKFQEKRNKLVAYKISLHVLADHFRNSSQPSYSDSDSGYNLPSEECINQFVVGGEDILSQFAQSARNSSLAVLNMKMRNYLGGIKCASTPSTNHADNTIINSNVTDSNGEQISLHKRGLMFPIAPIAALIILGFWAGMTIIASYFIFTPTLKQSFRVMSNSNRESIKNVKILSAGCDGDLFWGACGIPGTSLAQLCPGDGQLVFSNSCTAFSGYQPGSLICGPGIDDKEATKTANGDGILPVVNANENVRRQPNGNDRKQMVKYTLLGPGKFMCRSLCLKPKNPGKCNHNAN